MIDKIVLDSEESNPVIFSDICCPCKHYDRSDWDLPTGKCKAFPQSIPIEIWQGKNNHKKPYKNDSGIVFELDEFLTREI